MRVIRYATSPARLGFAVVLLAAGLYAGVYGVRAAVDATSAPTCPAAPVAGEKIAAVLGRPTSYDETRALVQDARHSGFRDAYYRLDPCGRLEVVVPELPDLKTAHDVEQEARSVGFHPTLERDP